MGELPKCIITSRGRLRTTDPTITLQDLAEGYFAGAASQKSVTRCLTTRRPDLMKLLVEYSELHGLEHATPRQTIVNCFSKVTSPPLCKVCGKPTPFQPTLYRYGVFCCRKCRAKDDDVKKKWRNTNLKKYGVDNPAKNAAVKEKLIATVRRRYGGASCYLASDEGRKKCRERVVAKYGVDHVMKDPSVRSKRDATMLERYGTTRALQNKELWGRRTETCITRFGNPYPGTYKLKELVEAERLRLYDELPVTFPDYEIMCSKEEFLGVYEHENTWRCRDCGSTFTRYGAPFCHCHLKWTSQCELYDIVKKMCPDAIAQDRSLLGDGREVDVYVPSRKIAFEYNGLYWHSERCGKDSKYHISKTRLAAKHGVQLVHIFEDEWLLHRPIVLDAVKSLLGQKRRKPVYARNCEVRDVDFAVAKAFLDKYHLLGAAAAPVNIGLFYRNRLVAVCSFKRQSAKGNSWYLERYAAIRARRVQGGCGKLLKHFIAKFRPAKIRTFADLRWSTGKMYERLGFARVKESRPAYWYVPFGAQYRIHRFNLRKENKRAFQLAYDPSMTERELAEINRYDRVWDCGQIVFELACQTHDDDIV